MTAHIIQHPATTARLAAYWRRNNRPDLADRLEAVLVAGGRCRRCGRRLTATTSVESGIGPECATKEETT
jgi:Family of unknown function (DUF6011)